MAILVHTGHIHATDSMAAAIIATQAWVGGVQVNTAINREDFSRKIIELQNRLVVLGKFSAGNVSRYIDDQSLAAKLIAVETASNT